MKVLVAGSGVGGLTTAVALRSRGIEAEIFEAAPGPVVSGGGLGITSNATRVLGELGLGLPEAGVGRVCEHFRVCAADGTLMREIPIRSISEELGSPVVNVRRSELAALLRDGLGDTPVHYGFELTDYHNTDNTDNTGGTGTGTGTGVTIRAADGRTATGDVLVGADGIRSAVRARMTGPGPEPIHEHGYVCWIATVPFAHPRLPRGAAAHFWGRGQRFGLMDIGDGRAYWWGTKNTPGRRRLRWAGTKEDILRCFDGWAEEVRAAIAATPGSDIVCVPAQDRTFLTTWGTGPVTLVGDAAHPMLTSLSQGAGTAIEDGHALARHLATAPHPVTALRQYEAERRERTRWLVSASRRLSHLEQLQNPIAVLLRDLVIRYAPDEAVRSRNIEPMRHGLTA
ncbi:FAD-dependent monooxygenase [Streptomyces clavuligerus]|uniref:Monooxygenase n=1 Tax=Streptomyces clavuligerus TaxID=1901 RepID=E2Q808_STRCL|nr:FAD-dependent monooxygenase [Streptomyces clavuligerus]ANW17905.1 FAD-dependent monooxygenase [Streptomyces clavuligerus]AXU12461.1 FAD-dependent monooxygenase [Streptomyces clavuligerus]EFG09540.1 Monooxygenase [Streptomyces clavuligerus]MBY6302352.1 FAD-dependent monooxygenase [Streptomyces clavuligerus]QCS05243.1 FAD-dependent monooxygenase [Streptomyces clavuligerus]